MKDRLLQLFFQVVTHELASPLVEGSPVLLRERAVPLSVGLRKEAVEPAVQTVAVLADPYVVTFFFFFLLGSLLDVGKPSHLGEFK